MAMAHVLDVKGQAKFVVKIMPTRPMLKCSHTTVYGISVCEHMLIHWQTLIYVRGMLGICRVRSEYADIRQCMLCYMQRPNYFLDMFKIYQRMRAYRIYVTHALTICTAYSGYARHALNMLLIRYEYAFHTFVKVCSQEAW